MSAATRLDANRATSDRRTPTARRRRILGTVLAATIGLVVVTSCASSEVPGEAMEEGAVADAAARLGAARRGTIDFSFLASTPGSSQVGFRIEGAYALDSPGPYPILDFTYTRSPASLGQLELRSRGDAIFVGTGGSLAPVPDAKLGALKRDDRAGIVADFGFADWISNPSERLDGDSIVTTGQVDVTGFLSDIVRIAAPVSGTRDLRGSSDAAAQLQRLVRTSEVRIVTDVETSQLRDLDVAVEFVPQATEQVRTALGPFGGVRLEVRLGFAPLAEAPTVDVPG